MLIGDVNLVNLLGDDFTYEREYLWGVRFAWWNHTVVQVGDEMIWQETLFGGYRVHLLFAPNWWLWNSSAWRIENILIDGYGQYPGGGARTPVFDIQVYAAWYPGPSFPYITFDCQPNNGSTSFVKMPPADPTWYREYFIPPPSDLFYVP